MAEKKGLGKAVKSAGAVVSKKEATQISQDTGKTVAQVMAKAQDRGQALGSSLVNNYNRGTLGPNTATFVNGAGHNKAVNALQALQGLRMPSSTVYMGSSSTTTPYQQTWTPNGGTASTPGSTTYNPIVLPRGTAGFGGGAGGAGGGAGGAGGGGGNGEGAKTKNDGTIESIKALYQEQMDAARAEIENYRNQTAEQINAMQLNMDKQIAATQSAADQEISYLNDLMMMQSQQSQQTQDLLTQQAQAAQAAYAEQARAAAALGKAFVPALEPTAASVQLGDQRQTQRQDINNTLSSLAITSSLGSNTNPLAGLQLA